MQIRFDGGGQREYLIDYSRPANHRAGWWRVASIRSPFGVMDLESPAGVGPAPFDLSDPSGVVRTETELSVDDESLEGLFASCPRHPLP